MAELQTPLTLVDWLDDLCVRFLLNLPSSELSSIPRICFQVEEAQWFYEDFVRPAAQASGAPPLPSIPLRNFCLLLFQHCPLLSSFTDAQHIAAYDEFLAYKVRVPVRGAILLDESMEKLVLVRGWKKGASWSFPRGKINKDEKDLDCAIREVYEETGYNLSTSGLIPASKDDLKYIDITMREQHMRLFVFRGVLEDTHFETQTRKEISKISWYWVKDLPGFKKQARNQQQSEVDTQQASKFYMVAPFLGPLKKWINLQRKNDTLKTQHQLSADYDLASVNPHSAVEEESEDHQTLEYQAVSVGRKEQDLRRLLNVGGGPVSVLQPAIPDPHTGNLLAMLQQNARSKEVAGLPHTPLEQINTFPFQSETPQPHHARQPSIPQQQFSPPPSFPFSPQRFPQEQQRNAPHPTPNIFGPGAGPRGYPQNHATGFAPGMPPPQLQHPQFQHQSQMPGPMPFSQQNFMTHNGSARPPMPPMQMRGPPPPQQFPPTPAFAMQGSQGAIASGPSIPNASQLPAPNLNPHTMRLLDAFKSGGHRSSPPIHTSKRSPSRPSSTHQAALLDLFKKPSAPTLLNSQPNAHRESPSPVQTDATEKPRRSSKAQERRPTLNEITRTLPPRPKAQATPPLERQISRQMPIDERQKSRQLFDPDKSEKLISATNEARLDPSTAAAERSSPVRILQRSSAQQPHKSPKPDQAAVLSSPSIRDNILKENGSRSSPFTILTRPGSSRRLSSPPSVATPASPSQSGPPRAPYQPQLLKRPQTSDAESKDTVGSGMDKRDQLLALFGQTSPTPQHSQQHNEALTASLQPQTSTQTSAAPAIGWGASKSKADREVNPDAVWAPAPAGSWWKKEKSRANQGSSPVGLKTLDQAPKREAKAVAAINASPAPQKQQAELEASAPQPNRSQKTALLDLFSTDGMPEQQRLSPAPPPPPKIQPSTSSNKQQSLLLDLFNKSSGTPAASPGTPISPFTLGTPAATQPPRKLPTTANSTAASPTSSGGTPVEAKEFLMGYLNGVVKNEGFRGAGSKR